MKLHLVFIVSCLQLSATTAEPQTTDPNNTVIGGNTIVSNDPGCVNGTFSDTDGFYRSLGTCNNHTVYMQMNSTIFDDNSYSTYILFYGTFTVDQLIDDTDSIASDHEMTTYAFYWCQDKEKYSINGETDNNDDNSANCANPKDVTGCSDSPKYYCSQYNDIYSNIYSSSRKDMINSNKYNYTSDNLPSFYDYCAKNEWKIYTGSTGDEYITTFSFSTNKNAFECSHSYDTQINDGIPDATSRSADSFDSDDSGGYKTPKQVKTSWSYLGAIIGIIVLAILFFIGLRRGKQVWEMRRARKPVVVPMGNDTNQRQRKPKLTSNKASMTNVMIEEESHQSMDDIDRTVNEDDRELELGSNVSTKAPEKPAPPIPMKVKNKMLHESMIDDNEEGVGTYHPKLEKIRIKLNDEDSETE